MSKIKKFNKEVKKQFKVFKPKFKKNIATGKKRIKKFKPKARRISRNIDNYFDENSRQIREFKFRI